MAPWEHDDGVFLRLFTPEEYLAAPIGTEVWNVNGSGPFFIGFDNSEWFYDDLDAWGHFAFGTLGMMGQE